LEWKQVTGVLEMSQKTIKVKVSDKYLKLVPRPTKEEFDVIKESILVHGQREPITINEKGVVLDGHTRYEILYERGLKIDTVTRTFDI
jgi:ParB-like chromosome segregation protein Spo0J